MLPGQILFGYRPYPDNVMRLTVSLFSQYMDIWRVYDFLNHVPNLKVMAEEVKKIGKLLMPCICFSTGFGHSDDFYLGKVEEIVSSFGTDIILESRTTPPSDLPSALPSWFARSGSGFRTFCSPTTVTIPTATTSPA